MKQIVDKLNKIAKKINENVELSDRDLIIDSLDSITKAYGGTPNDSTLIVDKLDDIYNNIGPAVSGNIEITENGENINVAPYATATVNVAGGGGSDILKLTVTILNDPESIGSVNQDDTNIYTYGYEVKDNMLSSSADFPIEYNLAPGESITFELLYELNSEEHASVGWPTAANVTASNIVNLTSASPVPDDMFYQVTDTTSDSSITLTYTDTGR